jgi:hypothetical protein
MTTTKENKIKSLMSTQPKTFSKMTKAEKRVAIAKDVLIQIKKGISIPTTDNYFGGLSGKICNLTYEKEELQNILPESKCEVCAKGALFIADILRRDNFQIDRNTNIYGGTIHKRLTDIFTRNQLDLIETAFEKNVIEDENKYLVINYVERTEVAKAAIRFGRRYTTEKNRLIGIMNNIIKNKGIFIP